MKIDANGNVSLPYEFYKEFCYNYMVSTMVHYALSRIYADPSCEKDMQYLDLCMNRIEHFRGVLQADFPDDFEALWNKFMSDLPVPVLERFICEECKINCQNT